MQQCQCSHFELGLPVIVQQCQYLYFNLGYLWLLLSHVIDVKYGCFFTFACLVNRTKKGFLVGHRPIKSPHGIGSLIGPNVFYFYK